MFAIFSHREISQKEIDASFEVVSEPKNSVSSEAENSEAPVIAASQVGDANHVLLPDGSRIQLRCVTSTLDAPLAERLTNHVRRKLGSAGLQALTGTTDILDGADSASSSCPAVLSCVQGDCLVCLVDASMQKLDAFHDQLCDFVRQRAPLLAAVSAADSAEAAASAASAASEALAVWEDATVAALQRSVKLLRNCLPALLTLVAVGCDLSVDCPEADRRREVERFIAQCRLLEAAAAPAAAAAAEVSLPSASEAEAQAEAPHQQFPGSAVLRIAGRSVSLDFQCYTEFAKTWAGALLDSVDEENPVRLQQRILDLKLRASRDVNAGKRLLAEAVSDYYALYRLVQALRQTGNAAVLLHNLTSLCSPDELEVIACVQAYLAGSCPLVSPTLTTTPPPAAGDSAVK